MSEKKEKSFEKRQELIDAAIKEFSDKGYENASLNNILKDAGISKGTFYYHFKNKEELYMYLIGIFIDVKMNFFAENIKPEDLNKDIFSLFKIMTAAGMKLARENPHISKFSESFLKERNNEIYEKAIKKYNFKDNGYLDNLIDNAYKKGELREDLPRDFTKRIIIYLFTHIMEVANIVKIDDVEVAANNLIEFMRRGLERK